MAATSAVGHGVVPHPEDHAEHLRMGVSYHQRTLPAVRGIPDNFPLVPGGDEYNHLGVLELGQDLLPQALAEAPGVPI